MEGKRTYFVSDVHLGLDVKDPAAREARFVEFLRGIPREETEALYMLGDIWDFWYEYRDVVPKGYVQVFAQLQDLMASGVKVYFFKGNHDIWTYHYLQDMGIEVLSQPHVVEIGGKTVCMGHGDGLGPGEHLYKLMRWTFHNPVFQWMFSLLHPWLAFRIGTGWSKSSRLGKSLEYTFRGEDEPLYKFAVELSRQRHIDYFIFGHFHCRVDMELPTGARLLVMKDWMEGSCYLYISGTVGWGGSVRNIE
ncbi:MAG: UDP-2,3-diacylglucosamine diphosphatase [Bacteroidales bacterium]|nr:UDP-2,3-diacylglucosamine diphosphatase [Bacteroidales bacterium]